MQTLLSNIQSDSMTVTAVCKEYEMLDAKGTEKEEENNGPKFCIALQWRQVRMGDCRILVCTCSLKQAAVGSCSGTSDLAVVVGGLHFQDVGDNAINRHITN